MQHREGTAVTAEAFWLVETRSHELLQPRSSLGAKLLVAGRLGEVDASYVQWMLAVVYWERDGGGLEADCDGVMGKHVNTSVSAGSDEIRGHVYDLEPKLTNRL